MQYNNLKNKAIELLIGNTWPYGFTGEMPNDLKKLFIEMADEICCLKARVDELEKKMTKIHFEEDLQRVHKERISKQNNGETES